MFLTTVFWLPNEATSLPLNQTDNRQSSDDKGLLEMVPTKHILCFNVIGVQIKGEAQVKFGHDEATRQTRSIRRAVQDSRGSLCMRLCG